MQPSTTNLVDGCAWIISESANHLQTVKLMCHQDPSLMCAFVRLGCELTLCGLSLIKATLTCFHLHAVIILVFVNFSFHNLELIGHLCPAPQWMTHLHKRSGQPSGPKVFDSSEAIIASCSVGRQPQRSRGIRWSQLILQRPDCCEWSHSGERKQCWRVACWGWATDYLWRIRESVQTLRHVDASKNEATVIIQILGPCADDGNDSDRKFLGWCPLHFNLGAT